MLIPDSVNSEPSSNGAGEARRALIIVDAAPSDLHQQLADSGYKTLTTTTYAAPRAISEFAPDLALVEVQGGDVGGKNDCVALARRLRAEPATYALPLVFVFSEDEDALRNSALHIGVDDYFALSTPIAEVLTRLDSLFWRVEAGRRAAIAFGDQRLEIDNFMLMLDSVREDVHAGASGTLALIYAVAHQSDKDLDKATRDRTLAEAHGFLKLNLRRADAVAFYGPTTLLVYLPRTTSIVAANALSRLRSEFLDERPGRDIAIGLASFPGDGADIEDLIEKAESAVSIACDGSATGRVVAHGIKEAMSAPSTVGPQELSPEPPLEAGARETAGEEVRASVFAAQVVRETKPAGAVEIRHAPPAQKNAVKANGSEALRAASAAAERERARRAGGAIMPRRLLLTVSDAARMVQLNSLVRAAGYEARAAFDGQQALDLLRIERPDLLLLDYELHGINGMETLRRLRKQCGGRLALPVILLLPSESEGERREALELGAQSVITTPYDPVELLACVRLAGSTD